MAEDQKNPWEENYEEVSVTQESVPWEADYDSTVPVKKKDETSDLGLEDTGQLPFDFPSPSEIEGTELPPFTQKFVEEVPEQAFEVPSFDSIVKMSDEEKADLSSLANTPTTEEKKLSGEEKFLFEVAREERNLPEYADVAPITFLKEGFDAEVVGDRIPEMETYINGLIKNNPGRYIHLVTKMKDEGKLSQQDQYNFVGSALVDKLNRDALDLSIVTDRGVGDEYKAFAETVGQINSATEELNKLTETFNSIHAENPSDPRLPQLKEQHDKLTASYEEIKGSADVFQDPDMQERLRYYEGKMESYNKTKSDLTNLMTEFPELIKQKEYQDKVNEWYEDGFVGQVAESGAQIWNKLTDAAFSLVTMGKLLADQVKIGDDKNAYSTSDKMLDGIRDFVDNTVKFGVSTTPFVETNEETGETVTNWKRAVPNLAGTLTDMFTLIYGGNKYSKVLGLTPKAGVFAFSFTRFYGENYQANIEQGLSPEDANNKALSETAVTAVLEGAFPEIKVFKGQVGRTGVAEIIKRTGGNKFKGATKQFLSQGVIENVEEISQSASEKVTNYVANKQYEIELAGNDFDTSFSEAELKETFLLTTASTILLGLASPNVNKQARAYALEEASNRFEKFTKHLEDYVSEGLFTKNEAASILKQVEDYKNAKKRVPDTLSDDAKVKSAELVAEKKNLEDEVSDYDDAFKGVNDKRIEDIGKELEAIYKDDIESKTALFAELDMFPQEEREGAAKIIEMRGKSPQVISNMQEAYSRGYGLSIDGIRQYSKDKREGTLQQRTKPLVPKMEFKEKPAPAVAKPEAVVTEAEAKPAEPKAEEVVEPKLTKYTEAKDGRWGYVEENGVKRDLTREEFEAYEVEPKSEPTVEPVKPEAEIVEPQPEAPVEEAPTAVEEKTPVKVPKIPTDLRKGEEEFLQADLEQLSKTRVYDTKDGRYTIKRVEDNLEIVNKKTGKPVRFKADQHSKYLDEYKESALHSLRRGKRAEMSEGMTMEDAGREIASTSENPLEIAETFIRLSQEQADDPSLEDTIAETLLGVRLTKETFRKLGDRNLETPAIRLNYFKKKEDGGLPLDSVVERVKETGNRRFDNLSDSEVAQRIIEFISEYPSGARTYTIGVSPTIQELKDRFKKITGFEIDREYAEKLISSSRETDAITNEEINEEIAGYLNKNEIDYATIEEHRNLTEEQSKQLESTVENIESKAESNNEAELNEAVKQAEEVVGKPKEEKPAPKKDEYTEEQKDEAKKLGFDHPKHAINSINQTKPEGEKYEKFEDIPPKELQEYAKERDVRKRKEEADAEIAEGLDELASFTGIIAEITGDERKTLISGLRKVASGLLKRGEIKIEELATKLKEIVEKKYHKFIDDNFDEIISKKPGKKAIQTKIEKEVGVIKEKHKIVVDEYQELKRSIKERAKAALAGRAESKRATDKMQDEVIEFIKSHKDVLKEMSGQNLIPLMKRVGKIRDGKPKSIDNVLDYIDRIVSGKEESDRKSKAKSIRSLIETEKKKATKLVSGRGKAGRYGQEGVEGIKAIEKAFDTEESDADARVTSIETEITGLESRLGTGLSVEEEVEIVGEIQKLQLEAEVMSDMSNLDNKSAKELEYVEGRIKEILKSFGEDLKEKRQAKIDRFRKRSNSVHGEVLGRDSDLETVRERGKRKGVRALSEYLAGQFNPKGLLNQLKSVYHEGVSELDAIAKSFEKGEGVRSRTSFEMKKQVEAKIKELFGSQVKMNHIFNKKMEIELDLEVKDDNGDVVEIKKVKRKVDFGTLAHLWASHKSESNHGYTQRIADVGQTLQLSEEEAIRIGNKLPENLTAFADWIVEDFLPSRYDDVNKVYKDRNFVDLPNLPDYLFVNAKKIRDAEAALTDLYRVSTYKPFTVQRTRGEYDLHNNNIYDGLLQHIDHQSKFIGLSTPISEANAILNSKKVSSLIEAKGLSAYKSALEHMMTIAMTGDKPTGVAGKMFYNFIGSKIKANFSLFPKQMVSLVTAFDPKYAPLGELAKSMKRLVTRKDNRKRAISILKQSAQFSTRNIEQIETHIKDGNFKAVQRIIDDVASKMDDATAGKAIKGVGEFLWNPTQKGDRFAVAMGGIPIIDAVYSSEIKKLKKKGITGKDADAMASSEALYRFNEWMNDTQQSMSWVGKSKFQTGHYKFAAPFMNSLMSYSRKILTSYRGVYGRAAREKAKLIENGDNPIVASVKSLKKVPSKDLATILLYQSVLPVLWTAVSSGGQSIIQLFSDDEEEREEAWMTFGFDAIFGWTKGLFIIGTVINYAEREALGKWTGKRADNIIRGLDDMLNLIDAVSDVISKKVKVDAAKTDREYEKQKARLEKAWIETGVQTTALLGLPSVLADRAAEVYENKDGFYDNSTKKALRIYGLPKKSIEDWYDFEKKPKKNKEKTKPKSDPKLSGF